MGQAGGSSYYPPCQLWMEPAEDYGTFCKATMEAAPIRTHFHPLCFFLPTNKHSFVPPLPAWPTHQAENQADTWSPRAALSKLNPPPPSARERKQRLRNVEIIKGELSRRPRPTVGSKKARHISESELIKIMRVKRCFLPSPPPPPSSLSPLSKCCKQPSPSQ